MKINEITQNEKNERFTSQTVFASPVNAAEKCWKFARPLSYNETKIYLLTNSVVVGTTFNNLFPESDDKYDIDINLYYNVESHLKADSTSVTLTTLNETKSILLTIDDDAIRTLGGAGGAGKEVPISALNQIEGNALSSIKTQLNGLFVNLTIKGCAESEAYVKEASTQIDINKCYKFVNVGGKYGNYYAYPTRNLVYGTLAVDKALEETIEKLIEQMVTDLFVQMMAKAFLMQLLPGLNIIASVEVNYIQSVDITRINITNINQDTGLLLTENVQLITGMLDECIEEGVKINKLINVEQLIRFANCFIKQNTTNVLVVMEYLGSFVQIPKNITVDMDMITPFLPMAAEYFDGLYLNKNGNVTLMVDVGDDVTIKAVGEEFDCSIQPTVSLLGFKEYIPLPTLNFIYPKSLFSIDGYYSYFIDSTKYVAAIVYSADVKDHLPVPLNTDGFKILLIFDAETSVNDNGETEVTVKSVFPKSSSYVYALNNHSASNLSAVIGSTVKKEFKWYDIMAVLNTTEFESLMKEELRKAKNISVKESDVTRGEDKRGKGTFKINGVEYKDLDVYFKFPPEEFEPDTPTEEPTAAPLPDDAKPLPRDKCYHFKADDGEFGNYFVDIQNGTVKGGIVVANALKNIGNLIPEQVATMVSFDNIFAWAEYKFYIFLYFIRVKLDYLDVGNLTKINVTEILETTYIQFTGLQDKSLVSMLSGFAPALGLLNKPIYLSQVLKNVGNILGFVSGFLPEGVVIPPGELGLHNITQFLPLAYEYFEGMYWSDKEQKAGFTVSVPGTVVNAIGKVIDCSAKPDTGLKETIPLYNYIFSVRNNIPDIKGIYVIGRTTNKEIVEAKLNCSDYPDLLPDSMKELNCYIRISYGAKFESNVEEGYTSITLNKYSDVGVGEKRAVINIEPRDEDTLQKMITILQTTNPDEFLNKVCQPIEYNSFIDLRDVDEEKKDEEIEKIYSNIYDGIRANITKFFGSVYLKYANIVVGKTGRVNLKSNTLENVVVWTTNSSFPELSCEYVIPPYNGDDDESGDNKPPNDDTSNISSSFFISYFFGLMMVILGVMLI